MCLQIPFYNKYKYKNCNINSKEREMIMKAMLIGGAGFVGKHLAIHLANTYGWEIVITGLPEEREAIERSSLGRFIPVNILEKGQIQAVLEQERPHYIFHLAAQSSVAVLGRIRRQPLM